MDGVSNGELRGWIVNLDRPGRMEPITCTGPTGTQARFCPFTFRSDVSQAMGVDGVFGFSIPVRMLTALGDSITVTRSDGEVIANGESVAIAARPRPRS